MTKTACFASRHKPTRAQLADFAAYRCVQVRFRFFSVRQLWLDVVLACGGFPDVLLLVWKNEEYAYAVKWIQRHSPRTIILRTLTEADNNTPTGLYCQARYVPGVGLRMSAWTARDCSRVAE